MNDNTLAPQMVAAAPAVTRNMNLTVGAGVGMAQFILGQEAIRSCRPFLLNYYNSI
ncbi:outer membrane scaffolding protein for murein synthesis (MipA/OmpV family) [Hymenobacter luteus]|uniref:Outer membrane scaffolding protein for murein synthesis (MipA/OmpV family) n=2 Tax=Hymenobacter TaxID=89966 RepID=A0A7W9SYZ5_9BACT|nr:MULTISPECIES: hypothetical protein [Hymenobacter]MBB4599745.1 outer membrane scaffolding protein for murein synthesis (MipA/OmpV family) [Hymenobacter latericoloratus]MBB6057945.1 outer membrane scaffolding protein for murein synthesis (MipA/OmpV family) [Hymenobacter luteus]